MTSLAKQLKQLQATVSAHRIEQSTRIPSLLFPQQTAKTISPQAKLMLAQQGFNELITQCRELQKLRDILQEKRVKIKRSLLRESQQEETSNLLRKLLCLLSLYFREESCLKILDALIHFYQIHIFQSEELLLFNLHHHQHPHFQALLSLFDKAHGLNFEVPGVKAAKEKSLGVREAVSLVLSLNSRRQKYEQYIVRVLSDCEQNQDIVIGATRIIQPFYPCQFYLSLKFQQLSGSQVSHIVLQDTVHIIKSLLQSSLVLANSTSLLLFMWINTKKLFTQSSLIKLSQLFLKNKHIYDQSARAVMYARQSGSLQKMSFFKVLPRLVGICRDRLEQLLNQTNLRVFRDMLEFALQNNDQPLLVQLCHKNRLADNPLFKNSKALAQKYYNQVFKGLQLNQSGREALAILSKRLSRQFREYLLREGRTLPENHSAQQTQGPSQTMEIQVQELTQSQQQENQPNQNHASHSSLKAQLVSKQWKRLKLALNQGLLSPKTLFYQFTQTIPDISNPLYRDLAVSLFEKASSLPRFVKVLQEYFNQLALKEDPNDILQGLSLLKIIFQKLQKSAARLTILSSFSQFLEAALRFQDILRERVKREVGQLLDELGESLSYGVLLWGASCSQSLMREVCQEMIGRQGIGMFWTNLAKFMRVYYQIAAKHLSYQRIQFTYFVPKFQVHSNVFFKSLALRSPSLLKKHLLLAAKTLASLFKSDWLLALLGQHITEDQQNFITNFGKFYYQLLNLNNIFQAASDINLKSLHRLLRNITLLLPAHYHLSAVLSILTPHYRLPLTFLHLNIPKQSPLINQLAKRLQFESQWKEHSLELLNIICLNQRVKLVQLDPSFIKCCLQDRSGLALRTLLLTRITPTPLLPLISPLQLKILQLHSEFQDLSLGKQFIRLLGPYVQNLGQLISGLFKRTQQQKRKQFGELLASLKFSVFEGDFQGLLDSLQGEGTLYFLAALLKNNNLETLGERALAVARHTMRCFKEKTTQCSKSYLQSVVECLKEVSVKLSVVQLRQLLGSLLKTDRGVSGYDRIGRITLHFRVFAALFSRIQHVFVQFAGLIYKQLIQAIKSFPGFFSSITHRTRPLQNHQQSLIEQQIQTALELLKQLLHWDREGFIDQDRFDQLKDIFFELFECTSHSNYKSLVKQQLIPAFLELVQNTSNDFNLKTLNNNLLLKTRHPDSRLSVALMQALEIAVLKFPSRYAFLTADLLQFLSQTVNSTVDQVQRATKSILSRLSEQTREDLLGLARARPV